MIPLNQISDGIELARLYNISRLKKLRAELEKGIRHCDFGDLICINRWIKALSYDVLFNINNDKTQTIYKLLIQSLNGFGGNYNIDPNVNIPGKTIVVNVISDGKPAWFDFSWDDMETADEDEGGGRYTYINPNLNGWNPSLQSSTTLLYRGVDYDMYAGGIIRFRTLPLYIGQSLRADNFQPFSAPPLPTPPIDIQYLWNRTNLKSDNSPSIGSRNISVTTNLGTTSYGSSSFIEITPQTVNIRQAGTDDLILVSGGTTVFLTGGNADNFVDTTELGEVIHVFNNNEGVPPTLNGYADDYVQEGYVS